MITRIGPPGGLGMAASAAGISQFNTRSMAAPARAGRASARKPAPDTADSLSGLLPRGRSRSGALRSRLPLRVFHSVT